jgi:cell wall-associated NlpC family hydrolase
MHPFFKKALLISLAVLTTLAAVGCGSHKMREIPLPQKRASEKRELPRLGYTIQVGAFANSINAANLTRRLQENGLDSTYFVARRGLYKVRFGNFVSRKQALDRADELKQRGIIEEYYIVSPEQYNIAYRDKRGDLYIRNELVSTARSFIGVPYLWGGSSADTGFDCSGLTMTVYNLNGMVLPRNSREQFSLGNDVDISSLQKGDLVFFAKIDGKVSHVGIYIGDDKFIHAPGSGKKIRIDSLEMNYYRRAFIGAKSYL